MKLDEVEAPVEEVCAAGADPVFDQLISALGHIARQKPKPLIDTIMFWRKAKGEAAVVAKQATNTVSEITWIPIACFRKIAPTDSLAI
jgi:hypothetical protein